MTLRAAPSQSPLRPPFLESEGSSGSRDTRGLLVGADSRPFTGIAMPLLEPFQLGGCMLGSRLGLRYACALEHIAATFGRNASATRRERVERDCELSDVLVPLRRFFFDAAGDHQLELGGTVG